MAKLNVQKVPSPEDRTLPVFAEFDKMLDEVRERAYRLFRGRGGGDGHALDDWLAAEREIGWPASELTEEDGEFELAVALPGFDTDEINVTATPRELIVKAAHLTKHGSDDEDKPGVVHWSELKSDEVFRRVELPAEIDVDKISAQLDRGMLKIEARKRAGKSRKPRKVRVASAD